MPKREGDGGGEEAWARSFDFRVWGGGGGRYGCEGC